MAKNVVYKPADNTSNIDFSAPKEIDKPEYDDKGVSYKGYSKTPIGNKEYILNPQEPADLTFTAVFAGAEKNLNCIRTNKYLKDFYCNKIILVTKHAFGLWNTNMTITIADGDLIRLRMFEATDNLVYTYIFDFETPLKFSKGNDIVLNYGRARAGGDIYALNLYGWEE